MSYDELLDLWQKISDLQSDLDAMAGREKGTPFLADIYANDEEVKRAHNSFNSYLLKAGIDDVTNPSQLTDDELQELSKDNMMLIAYHYMVEYLEKIRDAYYKELNRN